MKKMMKKIKMMKICVVNKKFTFYINQTLVYLSQFKKYQFAFLPQVILI